MVNLTGAALAPVYSFAPIPLPVRVCRQRETLVLARRVGSAGQLSGHKGTAALKRTHSRRFAPSHRPAFKFGFWASFGL